MPREGHISLEDLDVNLGYSVTESSLQFYTDEGNKFRNEARAFAQAQLAPLSKKIEREEGDTRQLIREGLKRMAVENYLKVSIPKEMGGLGKGTVYRTIMGEEFNAFAHNIDIIRGVSIDIVGFCLLNYGTEEQKNNFLSPLVEGEKVASIVITEPTGGCDAVGGMRARAVREGDSYILNGEKRFQTGGSMADLMLVYAITDPNTKARKGMSAFIMPTNLTGFEVVKDFELMGRRGVPTSHEKFNNCKVPQECLLGKENEGYKVLMHGLDAERTVTASSHLGIARSAFEIATKYTAERVQFGKPIREFEGVSFKVAEMYSKIEAMRMLILRAAKRIDEGKAATKDASTAKFFSADMSVEVCNDALQLMGGLGYTKEYPLEQYFRDVRTAQISAGSTQIQRLIVQREIYSEMGY